MRKEKQDNVIEIQEDVRLPNSDIILEKGDKISIVSLEEDERFNYQMLGRLQSDCEYAIKQAKSIRHLWGITVEDHIAEMRRLYALVREKPEWLSLEDIDMYERELLKLKR